MVAVINGEAAAPAAGVLALLVGGKAQADVLGCLQYGVAFGTQLGTLAVDAALCGHDVQVLTGGGGGNDGFAVLPGFF